MFRIGEFSKIAQVPGSLLRYYDEIGLLEPAHVDPDTGYRYYSARQLPRLHRILALKELGLTLDQIRRLADDEVSTAELRGMLTLRKAQVQQNVDDEMARLRALEARLEQIDGCRSGYDIVIKSVPEQSLLSVREVLPGADAALAVMRQLVETLPLRPERDAFGHFMTVVHSETLESDRLDIELGAVYTGPDELTVRLERERVLKVRRLPAVPAVAAVVSVGGFDQNCRSYGAIGVWVETNGYRICGPGREVLLRPPRAGRWDETVTEIQFPVERGGRVAAT
jgi:DNA-binding transcriptional MerR regulator